MSKTKVKPSGPNNLPAALNYARQGLKIFPILEGTKDQPLIRQWGINASSDAEQVKAWWTRWPQANIGLACGPSNIAVVDVDVKNGGKGQDTIDDLEVVEGFALTPTRMQRTPSGGLHHVYRGQLPNTVGAIGPGVDTRGGAGSRNGGYILLPPSATEVGRYEWLNRDKPAQVDQWIIDRCASAERVGPVNQEPVIELDQPANVAWADRWLKEGAEICKQGAGGDDTLVKRVVPILKDHGISEEQACELLVSSGWNDRCEPPWNIGGDPKDDLYAKVHNSYLYCRDRAPGAATAEAEFADDYVTAEDKAKAKAKAKEKAKAKADGDTPPRRNRLKARKFSELQDIAEPKWVVAAMVPDDGLTVLYGKPKRGKSFWALDLSLCVASGHDFFGEPIGRTGRVLYVAAEGGAAAVRNRVRSWLKARKVDVAKIADAWELVDTGIALNVPESVKAFLEANPGEYAMVILDTLARNTRGDENSAKDMSAAIKGCDKIKETTGGGVMLVHHEGWTAARIRGSSVLLGAPDAVIRIARDKSNYTTVIAEDMRESAPGKLQVFKLGDDGVLHKIAGEEAAKRQSGDKLLDILADLQGETRGEPVNVKVWRAAAKAAGLIDDGGKGRMKWARSLEGFVAAKKIKKHRSGYYGLTAGRNDLMDDAPTEFTDDPWEGDANADPDIG